MWRLSGRASSPAAGSSSSAAATSASRRRPRPQARLHGHGAGDGRPGDESRGRAPASRNISRTSIAPMASSIICNTRVVRLEGAEGSSAWFARTAARYEADLLIVGVGAVPNTELAARSGARLRERHRGRRILPHQRCGDLRRGRLHQSSLAALRHARAARIGRQRVRAGEDSRAQSARTGRRCTIACRGSGRISSTTSCSSSGFSGLRSAGAAR